MAENTNEITTSEWEVMRIVWSLGQVNSRDLIDLLQQKRDWQDSTIKTLIGRLVKKGFLKTEKEGRRFNYTATVPEIEAMDNATQNLFDHLCGMKKGQTLATLIDQTTLSQADILQLQQRLTAKAATAPEKVACDCLPDKCECGEVN